MIYLIYEAKHVLMHYPSKWMFSDTKCRQFKFIGGYNAGGQCHCHCWINTQFFVSQLFVIMEVDRVLNRRISPQQLLWMW